LNLFKIPIESYESRSAEASVGLLDEPYEKYSHVKPIRE